MFEQAKIERITFMPPSSAQMNDEGYQVHADAFVNERRSNLCGTMRFASVEQFVSERETTRAACAQLVGCRTRRRFISAGVRLVIFAHQFPQKNICKMRVAGS